MNVTSPWLAEKVYACSRTNDPVAHICGFIHAETNQGPCRCGGFFYWIKTNIRLRGGAR